MLQKNLKYFLLAGAALIWGIIIYKVISGLNSGDSDKGIVAQANMSVSKKIDIREPYELLANYDDPFGVDVDRIDSSKTTMSTHPGQNETPVISTEKIKPDLSFVQYKGIISNPKTHKSVAIISVNGKDHFVKLKEKIEDVTILSIQKSLLTIKYREEQFVIKRLGN